jgi:hypothetical protein
MSKVKHSLERATNIAVILVAAVVLGTFGWNYFNGRRIGSQLKPGLRKEAILPSLPGLNYGDSSGTLLIAMNTDCDFCKASVPFYNQLADVQRNDATGIRAVAVFPNSSDQVHQFVGQHMLRLQTIAHTNLDDLKVSGTPTLILVDRQGRIVDFWLGKLSPEEQEAVKRTIIG